MKIRSLKIAVSAVSILASLLLVALWVRSYWIADTIRWHRSGKTVVHSVEGVLSISSHNLQFSGAPTWELHSHPAYMEMPVPGKPLWRLDFREDGSYICFPYRLPIAIFALIAATPWIHWYFNLRAMLIVTAVIAMLLGLALSR